MEVCPLNNFFSNYGLQYKGCDMVVAKCKTVSFKEFAFLLRLGGSTDLGTSSHRVMAYR